MKIKKLDDFKNKKIAILWYWLEGKSTLSFLIKLWITDITILDKKDIKDINKDFKYITWDNYLDNLDDFDLIIKAPWISPYQNHLEKFNEKITTQTEIFTSLYNWKIIWITGTKWKSTTSTILYLTLKNSWLNVKLVGNIWTPVLDEIDIINWEQFDFIIYEMSSYMLEWFEPKLFIWFINNIYNCHLDWHDWILNYSNSKINILKNAKFKVANIEIKNQVKTIDEIDFFWEGSNFVYNQKSFYINWEKILTDDWFLIQWDHNRLNMIWIITILYQIKKFRNWSPWLFNKHINFLKETLCHFKWLPHRLEEIWTYKGILFIDDSIATTPESTIAAIKTYEHKIWTLFLWWYDYGFEFDELVKNIKKYEIKNLVLFPESGEKILWDLSNFNYDNDFKLNHNWYEFNILKTKSMEQAIIFAYKNTSSWKICLLSNASASYGLWSWYIEKWNQFQEFAKKHSIN